MIDGEGFPKGWDSLSRAALAWKTSSTLLVRLVGTLKAVTLTSRYLQKMVEGQTTEAELYSSSHSPHLSSQHLGKTFSRTVYLNRLGG